MTNTLRLLIIAAIWLVSMRAEACPPGYNCAAIAKYQADARKHMVASLPVLGGTAVLSDEQCNMPGGFQYSIVDGNGAFITGGCWRFSPHYKGMVEYSGPRGGDLWPWCAMTFYNEWRDKVKCK